jgi:hypothetical protein
MTPFVPIAKIQSDSNQAAVYATFADIHRVDEWS